MHYLSTTGKHSTEMRSALLNVSAPDGSLYIPEQLPVLPTAFIRNMPDMTPEEIGFAVANQLLGDVIGGAELRGVIRQAFSTAIPVSRKADGIYVAEMFHGPTLSYKDMGARFATGVLGHLLSGEKSKVIGIVSTTGNTGAALAAAFRQNMPEGSRLIVLYPSGKMTRAQIAQFTTPGNNVIAIEIAGDISDCRRLASALENEIRTERPDMLPVSLNSDNMLRVIPQTAVMFYIFAQTAALTGRTDGLQLFIPSGNLTNVTAAVIARRMGMPPGRIVSVTAQGSAYARAVVTGPSPVNLDRVRSLSALLSEKVEYVNVSDTDISRVIQGATDFLPDPHTAAAIHVARTSGIPDGLPIVVPATAHPAKSLDAMTAITGRAMELPLQLMNMMNTSRPGARIAPTLPALKKYLASALAAGKL